MRLTIVYSKVKKQNLALINNDTHQRETLSERPIRLPLSGAYDGVRFRGPLKGPWWGPGAKPPARVHGAEPPEACSAILKALERLSWHSFYNVLVRHIKL